MNSYYSNISVWYVYRNDEEGVYVEAYTAEEARRKGRKTLPSIMGVRFICYK